MFLLIYNIFNHIFHIVSLYISSRWTFLNAFLQILHTVEHLFNVLLHIFHTVLLQIFHTILLYMFQSFEHLFYVLLYIIHTVLLPIFTFISYFCVLLHIFIPLNIFLYFITYICYRFITDISAPFVPFDIPPTDRNRSDAFFLEPIQWNLSGFPCIWLILINNYTTCYKDKSVCTLM